VKESESLVNTPQAIRYTIAIFDPEHTNTDVLYQGGSSAVDVFSGTNETGREERKSIRQKCGRK
jgi:hypothetical protein